jgi:ABC-type histidine transport system ATPase subunit
LPLGSARKSALDPELIGEVLEVVRELKDEGMEAGRL